MRPPESAESPKMVEIAESLRGGAAVFQIETEETGKFELYRPAHIPAEIEAADLPDSDKAVFHQLPEDGLAQMVNGAGGAVAENPQKFEAWLRSKGIQYERVDGSTQRFDLLG
jgi:hypothetical protein